MSLPFKTPDLIEQLFTAIENHQDDGYKTIQELLKSSKDLILKNPDDNMPAIFAICKISKCSKILELIIGHVDVNVKYNAMTALEFVILNNSEEYLSILLESDKIDVNLGVSFNVL